MKREECEAQREIKQADLEAKVYEDDISPEERTGYEDRKPLRLNPDAPSWPSPQQTNQLKSAGIIQIQEEIMLHIPNRPKRRWLRPSGRVSPYQSQNFPRLMAVRLNIGLLFASSTTT